MLIDAALDLFHKLGYRNTSTAAVGAAAGISGPAVYRHFATKEELLRAVLDVSGAAMVTAAGEAAELPPEAGLERLLESYAALCVLRPGLSVVWLEERRNLSPDVRDEIGQRHQDFIWAWADIVAAVRPELSRSEAHVLGQLAIGLMTSVTFLHLDPRHPGQIDDEGLQWLLVDVARRVVLETPAAAVRDAVSPLRRDSEQV